MNLARRIKRNNLKTQIKEYEDVVRQGSNENNKLAKEIEYFKNKIRYLQMELDMARDVINALALADIRNNNFTSDNYRNYVSLPFSYLTEVNYNYTLNMKSDKDILVIEPVKNVKQGEGAKDADEEGKNITDNKGASH
jgi:branched-subunit amino acid aminotransferase/4-amino-4-deoxychorismate lyase